MGDAPNEQLNSSFRFCYTYLSSCFMWPWMQTEGKLQEASNLLSTSARSQFFTNTITWLKTSASKRSISFLFFSYSVSFMQYCCNPCRVNQVSLSIKISKGFFINFLQISLIGALIVAENIITCFWCGVDLKICQTSCLISISSRTLSHSSKTK